MATTLPVFNPEVESILEFLERLKVQAADLFESAKDDNLKKASILVKTLPVNIITNLQRRLKPNTLSSATFDQLETMLKSAYETKKSVIGATVTFLNCKQKPNESIENFARTLNNLCSDCKYRDCCRDRSLRDAFVSGLRSNKILGGLIQDCEDRTFNQCVEKAKMLEAFSADAQDIGSADTIFNLTGFNKLGTNRSSNVPADYVCIRCTARGRHFVKNCFALKLTCNRCNRKGHIRKACKSTPTTNAMFNDAETNIISSKAPQEFHTNQENICSAVKYSTLREVDTSARNTHDECGKQSELGEGDYFNPFF